MKKRIISILLALLLLLSITACTDSKNDTNGGDVNKPAIVTYASRADVPEQYKWNLADIYPSLDDFDADATRLTEELIPLLASFKGKLDGSENVGACLEAYFTAKEIYDRLHAYAFLGFYADKGDAEAQTLYGRVMLLDMQLEEASSFIDPELSNVEESALLTYLSSFPDYAPKIQEIIKGKPHALSEEESILVAMASLLTGAPAEIYSMLNTVDINLDGDTNPYVDFANTFAQILASEVNKNIFLARAHNYNSALESAIAPDIPVSVYENLLASVDRGLPASHEYFRLRKEALGLDTLQPADLYLPLLPDTEIIFDYEDAMGIVLAALEPLGEDYRRVLETAFSENWIDVHITPNKEGGGFCEDVYSVHPYILLNYTGEWYEVSTLAHELGHAVHMYYSSNAQPFSNAEVTGFTSEAAAIANEIILAKYMISRAETNTEKLAYIDELLSLYNGTFFGQAMFAEFEKTIHEAAENGATLNAEMLCNIWEELTIKYYGDSCTASESTPYVWASVPHFYYNFYVFQYATSIAAANQIAAWILGGDPDALDRYMTFLHSGKQYDSITTFANLGIDMNSPQVFDVFVDEYSALVAEMERLLREEGLLE